MSLDLTELVMACDVVPEPTADPALARVRLLEDGAVILTGLDGSRECASGLAELLLADRLRASGHPIEVTDGGGMDRRPADAARQMLALHTDGFAYGALAPDVVILLGSAASRGDGLSFLVDQQRLLAELMTSREGAELARFVRTHDVDQSETGGIPAIGPIALPLPSGVEAVRRSLDVRPHDADPDPATTARHLALWQGILDGIGALCRRFPLEPGHALAIDNARLAHGRDAYTTPGRLLWRCWAWTDRSGGIPDGELWSDTRMVLGRTA
jgi:hypothetical protein